LPLLIIMKSEGILLQLQKTINDMSEGMNGVLLNSVSLTGVISNYIIRVFFLCKKRESKNDKKR